MMIQIQAIVLTIFVQAIAAGLIFVAGLLDPLLMLWAVGIYFFLFSPFFMYKYFLRRSD